MRLVKLKSSNFKNKKEKFSAHRYGHKDPVVDIDDIDDITNKISDEAQQQSDNALEVLKWYVNKVNIPMIVFAISSLYFILTTIPGTQADELYTRFSGQYEELLCKKINNIKNNKKALVITNKIKIIKENTIKKINIIRETKTDDSDIKSEILIINEDANKEIDKLNEDANLIQGICNGKDMDYSSNIINLNKDSSGNILEEDKLYLKYQRYKTMKQRILKIKGVEYIYIAVNTISNPISSGWRSVINPPSESDKMANKIIHRMIEKNGFMNNIVFEFMDWYNEGPIFYTLMWLCTAAMFVPVYIKHAQTLQPLLLDIVNFFINTPSRRLFIKVISTILTILLAIAWAFIMPLLSLMGLMSVYMLWFWAIPIIIFHYKDLLCEVERGGYKRDPLLLPVAKPICKFFNNLMIGPLKDQTIVCEDERTIMKEICNAVEKIPPFLWGILITPVLVLIQIVLLYISLILKLISILNVVTLSYYFAKKEDEDGPVFTLPKVVIGPLTIPKSTISLRMPWMKSATNKWWLPIEKYIQPEKWSNDVMVAVDWITCLDPYVWLVNDNLISKPAEEVGKFLEVDIIKMKHPKRCEPGWKWIKPITFERQEKDWKPGGGDDSVYKFTPEPEAGNAAPRHRTPHPSQTTEQAKKEEADKAAKSATKAAKEAAKSATAGMVAGYPGGYMWTKAGGLGDPRGTKKQTIEECRSYARDNDFAGVGYRTTAHPSPAYRNTCFFFKKPNDDIPNLGFIGTEAHYVGCTDPDKSWGDCPPEQKKKEADKAATNVMATTGSVAPASSNATTINGGTTKRQCKQNCIIKYPGRANKTKKKNCKKKC